MSDFGTTPFFEHRIFRLKDAIFVYRATPFETSSRMPLPFTSALSARNQIGILPGGMWRSNPSPGNAPKRNVNNPIRHLLPQTKKWAPTIYRRPLTTSQRKGRSQWLHACTAYLSAHLLLVPLRRVPWATTFVAQLLGSLNVVHLKASGQERKSGFQHEFVGCWLNIMLFHNE